MPTQTGKGTGLGSPYTASLCAEVWVELRSCILEEEEPGLRRETHSLGVEAHRLVGKILEETLGRKRGRGLASKLP